MPTGKGDSTGGKRRRKGGFIPVPVAAAIIGAVGPPIVNWIVEKIKGKKSGEGGKRRRKHKK